MFMEGTVWDSGRRIGVGRREGLLGCDKCMPESARGIRTPHCCKPCACQTLSNKREKVTVTNHIKTQPPSYVMLKITDAHK